MCTGIVQIIYVVILAAGAGLTMISLATPAWKEFHNGTTFDQSANGVKSAKQAYGLFTGSCGGDKDWTSCKQYFMNAPDWQKAAMACLIVALLACVAAFIWSCIACFACCCRACLTPPLPFFSGLACLLDIVAVVVYAVKSGEQLGNIPTDQKSLDSKGTFGYSFWVGIGAIVTLAIDTIVGICLVTTSKVSPI